MHKSFEIMMTSEMKEYLVKAKEEVDAIS